MRSESLTAFFRVFTHTGDWQVVTLVCILFLLFQRTRKTIGYPVAFMSILSTSLYEILKFIFQRERPPLHLHLIEQGGYSFPSGHSISSLMTWVTFLFVAGRWLFYSSDQEAADKALPTLSQRTKKTAFFLLAVLIVVYVFLMGFSRVYLGVHYPSDVLASWLLGTCLLIWFHSDTEHI